MNFVLTLVLTLQMLAALGMVGLILMQQGKGADMGAAFGSGSSGSLFGASGGANFMSRTTAVLATVFFVCTLALASMGHVRAPESSSVLESAAVTAVPAPQAAASAAPVVRAAASGVAQIPVK
jgi:preprotein translocase subunit SecG